MTSQSETFSFIMSLPEMTLEDSFFGNEMVGQEEVGEGDVGGGIQRVQTAWLCLGLTAERPWLDQEGHFCPFLHKWT